MRILLLMRGVPGSGKSTFIKEQGAGALYIECGCVASAVRFADAE